MKRKIQKFMLCCLVIVAYLVGLILFTAIFFGILLALSQSMIFLGNFTTLGSVIVLLGGLGILAWWLDSDENWLITLCTKPGFKLMEYTDSFH